MKAAMNDVEQVAYDSFHQCALCVYAVVQCERQLSYCRRLREVIDEKIQNVEPAQGLRHCLFDKPHMNLYVMYSSTHQTVVLELKMF